MEKDFFFQHLPDEQFLYWSREQREASKNYRGAFLDYVDEMELNDREKRESLLPKFYMLFRFEVVNWPLFIGNLLNDNSIEADGRTINGLPMKKIHHRSTSVFF